MTLKVISKITKGFCIEKLYFFLLSLLLLLLLLLFF